MYRVLVIGGYGLFGKRLVDRLLRQPGVEVIVCGRSAEAVERMVARWLPGFGDAISGFAFDALSAELTTQLVRLSPDVVVHTSGPFQGQTYAVAQACIAAAVHYIDLADAGEFVEGISSLDAAARKAGVMVCSGASSVPALSSAAVDLLAEGVRELSLIDIGISPGNQTERGLSTIKAVTSYCGKPLANAGLAPVKGWSTCWQHEYPYPVGSRLLSPCDVPDLKLFVPYYSGRPAVRFGAGLELRFLHRAMNMMAWMAERGWVRDWSRHAHWLKRIADLFQRFGSDAGAMHVAVVGVDSAGQRVERRWQLLALDGDGAYVPALAASALVRKLAAGEFMPKGAMPCIGLLALADFEREAYGLNINMKPDC